MLEKPDILLLDEPTNYLDEEHINWLRSYLQAYENAFVLISHDVDFMNDVINIIYHVNQQKIDRYVGDYHNFERLFEEKKKQLASLAGAQQAEAAKLKDFIAKKKANVATSGQAKARQKKLDKMTFVETIQEKAKPSFEFKLARTASKLIFEATDLVIGYDASEPLSSPINLTVERGQKVAFTGSNGIGKSTLLKSLLGELKPLSGTVLQGEFQEIGYFAQEDKNPSQKTVLEEYWNTFSTLNQAEVRAALARCGLGTKQIESRVYVLSGGEQSKLRLGKIMNHESNILVMDEPTNHLDVDAKDELKRALQAYKGTILMVSHEPEFYQDIVSETIDCENWTTKVV